MAKVTIGGQEYETQPLNFKALKKVWPAVATMVGRNTETVEEGMEAIEIAIKVVAIAFERSNPDMTADWIEDRITVQELPALQVAVQDIMVESGIAVAPGEAKSPAKKAKTLTGTLNQ